MRPFHVAVSGQDGHMGRAVVAVSSAEPDTVVLGFGRPAQGQSQNSRRQEAIANADVIIDFSTAAAAAALAQECAVNGGPALVIGVTGFDETQLSVIAAAAKRLPIIRTGNFSIGLNTLIGLVKQTAAILPDDAWDVEVLEAHHRRKKDAPSGTALMLGNAAAKGRNVSLASAGRLDRSGTTGPRANGEIGFASLRGGGIVGDHSVYFAAIDEVITLSHQALDRTMFARGALRAARWVVGRDAGEYDMFDVLGLS